MILYLLIIFTVMTLDSWLLIDNIKVRLVTGWISILLLLISTVSLSANMNYHFGMQKEITYSSKKIIYTAGPLNSPKNLLITKEIGSNSNNYILIYRNSQKSIKPSAHFVPNRKQTAQLIRNRATYRLADVQQATIQKEQIKWVYKNQLMKTLFKVNDETELIKQKAIVTVPKTNWIVIPFNQINKNNNLKI